MSEPVLVARCPAKVNLSLRVIGRRDDGYHELHTIFQAIDLWDTIVAKRSRELSLVCDDPAVPVDASNLVLRAAASLRGLSPRAGSLGAALELRKRIPVGGGLGGGSSDAAGALLLLARLWSLPVGLETVESLAGSLGADVPFFLHGGTAIGSGRGDRIEPLPFGGPVPLVLGFPPFGIATREVYERFDAKLTPTGNDVRFDRFTAGKWPRGNDLNSDVNDLEEVVFAGWPELSAFRDALLRCGASRAHLSGSGSTVFGVFQGSDRAEVAQAALGSRFTGWRVLGTRSIPDAAHLVATGVHR